MQVKLVHEPQVVARVGIFRIGPGVVRSFSLEPLMAIGRHIVGDHAAMGLKARYQIGIEGGDIPNIDQGEVRGGRDDRGAGGTHGQVQAGRPGLDGVDAMIKRFG